jgi:diadenosine tetraphosphatase ApaH/serine/threonine PP2A family protein phosphatase
MYGKVSGTMTEETPFNPCSKKGEVRAKIATSLMNEWKTGALTAMIARAADFYGPETPNGLPNFLVFEPFTKNQKASWLANDSVPHSCTYTPDAARSLISTEAHATFCGHIHRPALYSMSITAKMTSFIPSTDVPVQLSGGRQWLAVLGSVGQPRDGDPAASFAMYDTRSGQITYCRVPYDVEAAAMRIRENGLPHWLADRLRLGR